MSDFDSSTDRRRDPVRWGISVAGISVLASLVAFVPFVRDAPGSLLSKTGLPGAEWLPTNEETQETALRHTAIAGNLAKPIETVITATGVKLEFYQAGVGANASNPIKVDPVAAEATLDYVINHMSTLQQNVIDPDDITSMQRRAVKGDLEDLDIAIVLSDDPNYCAGKADGTGTQKVFVLKEASQQCAYAGSEFDDRGDKRSYRPSILVTSLPADSPSLVPFNSSLQPGGLDFARVASVPGSTNVSLKAQPQGPMDNMYISAVHEIAHAVAGYVSGNNNHGQSGDNKEHTQIVFPTSDYARAYICSLPGLEQNPLLRNPFSIGSAA